MCMHIIHIISLWNTAVDLYTSLVPRFKSLGTGGLTNSRIFLCEPVFIEPCSSTKAGGNGRSTVSCRKLIMADQNVLTRKSAANRSRLMTADRAEDVSACSDDAIIHGDLSGETCIPSSLASHTL